MKTTADIIVVGAGITGLHCAAELERLVPSARVLVLEATDVVGGRIRGKNVDLGAHSFGERHRRVGALVDQLAPGERIDHVKSFGDDPSCRSRLSGKWKVTPRSHWYFDINGLTSECPPSESITIVRSVAAFRAMERLVDVERPWNTPFAKELDAISFQEWIDSQSLPFWVVQRWQTSSLGIASVHARDVSLLWWLWSCASNGGLLVLGNDSDGGPQQFSVRGGLSSLVARYAKTLRSEVRLNAPVKTIDHVAGTHVTLTLADGELLTCKHVIVAATPHAVGKNMSFSPSLAPARQSLHAQPMGHAVKAVLQYREPWWWKTADGAHLNTFFTSPADAGIEWAIDTSSESDGHFSLMAFVSDRLVDSVAPEALREAVLDCAVELTGDPRARDVLELTIYDWRTNPYVGGGPNTAMRPGVLSRLGGSLFESESARLHFASSEQSPEFTGYVEGGMAAAERVAEHVREAWLAERGARERKPVPARPSRGTDAFGTLALGAGFAAMTPLWLARPLIDGAWRLLRR